MSITPETIGAMRTYTQMTGFWSIAVDRLNLMQLLDLAEAGLAAQEAPPAVPDAQAEAKEIEPSIPQAMPLAAGQAGYDGDALE